MRKFTISALLFPVLFGLTVPVGSQTRPRRVNQLTDTSVASNLEVRTSAPSNSEVRTQERPRATSERPPAVREGVRRESRWPGLLLSTGSQSAPAALGTTAAVAAHPAAHFWAGYFVRFGPLARGVCSLDDTALARQPVDPKATQPSIARLQPREAKTRPRLLTDQRSSR
jgi:hypothetical protein